MDDEPIVHEVVVRYLARAGHRTLEAADGSVARSLIEHRSPDLVVLDVTARFAPDKLERVLMNLLTNSLRHTPSDGAVAVLVEPQPTEVRVAVEDTGAGHRIWAEDREGGGARVCLKVPAV